MSVAKEPALMDLANSQWELIGKAELSAKAALANAMKTTKLSGVKRLYNCEISGETYVGVYVNSDGLMQAESMRSGLKGN